MSRLKKPTYFWVITVAGYGDFIQEGTEEEAEEMRKHKANWEQGVGRKFRCDSKINAEALLRRLRKGTTT